MIKVTWVDPRAPSSTEDDALRETLLEREIDRILFKPLRVPRGTLETTDREASVPEKVTVVSVTGVSDVTGQSKQVPD